MHDLIFQTIEYFLGLDIKIQEMYGMSETTGPHTIHVAEEDNPAGTVGRTLPSFQSRLVEVWAKFLYEIKLSNKVFQGGR